MMSSTIEITEGVNDRTSRLSLKKTMEFFGEVDACHMGNRGLDYPFVRFRVQASADAAVEALKAGRVFLDGIALGGEWKGAGRRSGQNPPPEATSRRREDMDVTSRDLIMSRDEKKDRSRSRRRRRDDEELKEPRNREDRSRSR